jgi:uncharacterized linocin/CFP29 family protein
MHSDLVECGWTEEQWNRISGVLIEEAQKARVAAQVLPVVGPEEASTIAIPTFTLGTQANPYPFPQGAPPLPQPVQRLSVDSDPTLFITTIAVNVPLRSHEMADPELKAAVVMFRRAANYVARIEDALVFGGRAGPNQSPLGLRGIPTVYSVTGNGTPAGIFAGAVPRIFQPLRPTGVVPWAGPPLPAPPLWPLQGEDVFRGIVDAIDQLELAGQLGPYACVLSQGLFELVCTPNPNFVLPRDRILPFLEGPLLRSSQIANPWGCVVALSGSPIELVVASDISVRFLQTTLEPRYVFRVSERVALRIKESQAIALMV